MRNNQEFETFHFERAGRTLLSPPRAFVYAACLPGAGEYFTGSRLRGILTFSAVILFTAWFTWLIAGLMTDLFEMSSSMLSNGSVSGGFQPPVISLTAAGLGFYFAWLWGMFSAVSVSVENSEPTGSRQTIAFWGVVMSWVCPGSGQVYTGKARYGLALFGLYLLSTLFLISAYRNLGESFYTIVSTGKLNSNPYAIIGALKELDVRLQFGFAALFRSGIEYLAVIETILALNAMNAPDDRSWISRPAAKGCGLFALGWVCPGAPQMLQGGIRVGVAMFAAYFGFKTLIGLLLGAELIQPETANVLKYIPVVILLASMIEAPVQLVLGRTGAKKK